MKLLQIDTIYYEKYSVYMLTNDDLQAIKGIVKGEIKPLKKQLDIVEMKVELVNKKVDHVAERLDKKIETSQEKTIDILSELIHAGYNLHEVRIKKIEDHLQTPQAQ